MRSRLQKIGDQSSSSIEPFFTLHLNIEVGIAGEEGLFYIVERRVMAFIVL